MRNGSTKSPARDRWEQWVLIIILFLLGLVLFLISIFLKGSLQQAFSSIGLSFIGTAFVTGIILALVGSDVGGLKREVTNLAQEVENLHKIIEEEIGIMYRSVGSLSALLNNAYRLGIVELGRSRQSTNFEEGKSFVERWKYLLEFASEVDVVCFADRSLFNSDVFSPFFIEKIRKRMGQESVNHLKLRVIISSLDNPFNKEIISWSPTPGYNLESRIVDARNILKRVLKEELKPEVIREHNSFVPFTLLRGDNFIYIMFYMPGHDAGPVLEIRPLEMIAHTGAEKMEDDNKLFRIYISYFEDMWLRNSSPIIPSDTPQKP